MPAMPAFDLKMPLSFLVIFLTRKIDMKDPENLEFARFCLAGGVAFTCLMYLVVYLLINSKKNDKTVIWVPPKVKPAMPFGPAAAPAQPHEYVPTTYYDHEFKLLKDGIGSGGMSLGIACLMSFQFNIHMSVWMQAVLLPFSVYDLLVCRKNLGLANLFNSTPNVYGELMEAPPGAPTTLDTTETTETKKTK